MPAPLLAPSVPLGFPPLATASDQTTPKITAGSQTVSPGRQIAHITGAGSPTMSLGS
jgi:hypothetical protein